MSEQRLAEIMCGTSPLGSNLQESERSEGFYLLIKTAKNGLN